eukprot:XP_002937078.1 PREDICTED: membrane-spanning 4-domains subfamily A member 4A-like [Xenopus tropicalis]
MALIQPDTSSSAVISQEVPQNDLPDITDQNSREPTDIPRSLKIFFSGEPEALGVTQIFTGIMLCACGISFASVLMAPVEQHMFVSIIPLVCGFMYTISGSLSVAAFNKPTIAKVKASLALNTLSSVIALLAMLIFIAAFLLFGFIVRGSGMYCACYKENSPCEGHTSRSNILFGINIFYLFFTILEFCISLSTSIFACRTMCLRSANEMTVVIYQAQGSLATNTGHASVDAGDTLKPSQDDDEACTIRLSRHDGDNNGKNQ